MKTRRKQATSRVDIEIKKHRKQAVKDFWGVIVNSFAIFIFIGCIMSMYFAYNILAT